MFKCQKFRNLSCTRDLRESCCLSWQIWGGINHVSSSSSLARYFWTIYFLPFGPSPRLQETTCIQRACLYRWSVRKIGITAIGIDAACGCPSIDQSSVKIWSRKLVPESSKNETTHTPLASLFISRFPVYLSRNCYSRTLNIWLTLRSRWLRDYVATDNILGESFRVNLVVQTIFVW